MFEPRGLLPILSKYSYVFSLDAETDGLYGDVFAIGVSLDKIELTGKGNILKPFGKFKICADLESVQDPWVKKNVIPKLVNDSTMQKVESRLGMLNLFWDFYMKYRKDSFILVDFGIPVEAKLFRECIEIDRKVREFQGPYPAFDLGTILACCGIDPDINRAEFVGYTKEDNEACQHNPYFDAMIQSQVLSQLYTLG